MQNSSKKRIYAIAFAALFCALTFIATYVSIPAPLVGNVNLGDGVLIFASLALGGSAFACAVGAALCDLASGYAIYAPATLIIKLLMVLAVLLIRRYLFKKDSILAHISAAVIAELIMMAGYLVYEGTFLGYGWAAALNLPFNAIQGAIGSVLGIGLYLVAKRVGILKHTYNNERK